MMTQAEAFTIAAFRIHFGCSFSKMGGLGRAIWGLEKCQQMAEVDHVADSMIGRALISAMEKALGFEMCETDTFTMGELVCMNCKGSLWSIHKPADVAKECPHCGEIAAVSTQKEA